jgi:hypothetical protein
MSQNHLRPLSSGEILDSAFGVYRRHFVPLFVTTLLPVVPLALASTLLIQGAASGLRSPDDVWAATLPSTLLGLLGFLVMWGALTRQVEQAWTGGEVSVMDGYRAGFRAFFRLLGAMIASYLVLLVIMFAILLGFGLVSGIFIALAVGLGMTAGGEAAGGVMAVVLSVVVGIVVLLAMALAASSLFAVLPAVVVERAGPVAAIRRSMALARGARRQVAGIVVVAFLIVFLPAMGVSYFTGGFDGVLNPGHLPTSAQLVAQQIGGSVVGALTTPFLVAALVLLYFDRRVRTEALDVRMAADALPPL